MSEVRLIDANALKELEPHHSEDGYRVFYEYEIDNAPTVEPEKVLVANVTFDVDELKEIVQTEVIDKIKSGELVLKDERPQGEWIPVSERLPDVSQRYLVSTYDDVMTDFFMGDEFMQGDYITAWQPLPEPYKKGGAE